MDIVIPQPAWEIIMQFVDDRIETKQKKHHTEVMTFIKYFKSLALLIKQIYSNPLSYDFELTFVELLYEYESENRCFTHVNQRNPLFILESFRQ